MNYMNDNDTRFLDDKDLRILMDNLDVTSTSTYDEIEIIKYSSDLTAPPTILEVKDPKTFPSHLETLLKT